MLDCLAIVIMMNCSMPASAVSIPEDRDILHFEQILVSGNYVFDVSTNANKFVSHLTISSVKGGRTTQIYEEGIIGERLNGVFNNKGEFVTIWSAGSADWIKIFHMDGNGASKVLDQPTRSFPVFAASPTGEREIILRNDSPGDYLMNPGMSQIEKRRLIKQSIKTFIWNGYVYSIRKPRS